ncbi:MAG: type II toxin-antitoxin system Phd/YefM family antitoxin [Acidobacteria bacterium]|nr:type II toxin-antitoxin system Phd/YefM family antitoxin [Acidobacteriota bacterium]
MTPLTLTALRKKLYEVVDRVLETGVPAVVERRGRRLLIIPDATVPTKLSRLKRRRGIVGDPDDLVSTHVGEWTEARNLDSRT